MSVSFSGELAYEIHVPNNQLYAAYLALRAAGGAHDLRLFGARAVESMRMEKGYLHWKADLITEFDPFETGLDRFVKLDKDFVGKAALQERHAKGSGLRKLVSLQIDCGTSCAQPGASVVQENAVVGTVTSGEWGHRVGMNLAYAFVHPDFATQDTEIAVDLLGETVPCRVIAPCPYDPDTIRPRT